MSATPELRHRCSIVSKCSKNKLIDELSEELFVDEPKVRKNKLVAQLSFHSASLLITKAQKIKRKVLLRKDLKFIKESMRYKERFDEFLKKSLDLKPNVERRSLMIDEEVKFILSCGLIHFSKGPFFKGLNYSNLL